jgi:hypothetical protein
MLYSAQNYMLWITTSETSLLERSLLVVICKLKVCEIELWFRKRRT